LARAIGSKVGVYIGQITSLYHVTKLVDASNKVLASGNLAGNLSREFGFTGPSVVVDTLSASSLTAIHMACTSLRHGECEVALAGGVTLLHPDFFLVGSQFQLMASGVERSSFAHGRDGLLFGEGAGAVLLKPLSKAVRDNDVILAVIRSTVSSSSNSQGYESMPDIEAMSNSITENITKSGIDPRTINYVESSAMGLMLGDAMELTATSKAFRRFTEERQFCALGSVKPNIGHLAAAAGVSQFIKVVMQMQRKQLAPTIKATPVGADLNLDNSPFYLQSKATPWLPPRMVVGGVEQEFPRRALINTTGYGGFYAGAILEEYGVEESVRSAASATKSAN
jgi:acyl transferase domain-containing protein